MPFGHGHWAIEFFPGGFSSRMRRRLWKRRRRRGHLEKMEHRSRQNQRFVGTNAEVILVFFDEHPMNIHESD